jgi:hypothetical protein
VTKCSSTPFTRAATWLAGSGSGVAGGGGVGGAGLVGAGAGAGAGAGPGAGAGLEAVADEGFDPPRAFITAKAPPAAATTASPIPTFMEVLLGGIVLAAGGMLAPAADESVVGADATA